MGYLNVTKIVLFCSLEQHFIDAVLALRSYVTLATIQNMSLKMPAALLAKSQESAALIASVGLPESAGTTAVSRIN